MPKVRHLAIACDDPEGTARFYEEVFGMQRVGQVQSHEVDGVYISDGEFNMAFLNFKAGAIYDEMQAGDAPKSGLHHVGFLCEDLEETRSRLRERGAPARNQRPLNANMFFEEKFTGPAGVIIDVTDHAWPGAAPLPAEPAKTEV